MPAPIGWQAGSTSSQNLEIHKKLKKPELKHLSRTKKLELPVTHCVFNILYTWVSKRACALNAWNHWWWPQVLSTDAVPQDQSEPLIQYHDLLQLLSAAIIDTIIHQPDQRCDPVSWTKRKQSGCPLIRSDLPTINNNTLWGCSLHLQLLHVSSLRYDELSPTQPHTSFWLSGTCCKCGAC